MAKRELTDTRVQGPRDQLLTIDEVAAWLGVSKTFIYRRTCKGHADPIPSYRFGGHLRFRRNEVEDWIQAHRNHAAAAVTEALTQTLYLDRPGPTGRRRS